MGFDLCWFYKEVVSYLFVWCYLMMTSYFSLLDDYMCFCNYIEFT